MAQRTFQGVIPAIATPINVDGEPDSAAFIRLAHYLLANGADGLNMLGTTGEATSLAVEQRKALVTAVARSDLPLERIIVGTGAAAVADAAILTKHAAELGLAGALVLPPFYYKSVNQDGLLAYFDRIVAGSGDLPIYLYNFPAMSGIRFGLSLIERLCRTFGSRIAGLKDSSGDLAYAREVASLEFALAVFPSNEAVLPEVRSGIFCGCISATANLNSDLCARAYRDESYEALAAAISIRELFTPETLIPGVKSILASIHREPALARLAPPLSALPREKADRLTGDYRRIRDEFAGTL